MTEALTCGTSRPIGGRDLPQPTDHRPRLSKNQVVALFADSSVSFRLSIGATFADLAERLDRLSERHAGNPTAVYLSVGEAERPIPALQPKA